jgi:glycosyltransferase involved in cell wall biosynthesis
MATEFSQIAEVVVPASIATRGLHLPKFSVIMPAYNEQGRIAGCIASAKAHLEWIGAPYEIIVVDDGSTDDTRAEAMSVRSNPHVNVLGYMVNHGKGFAIQYGAKYATGDIVIFMDSDSDVKPEIIGQYVTMLKSYDIAIASKRHPGSRVSAPIMRKLLSHAFHCSVMLLTGIRVSDTQSGLKAFRREALSKIMALITVKHYAFDVELLAIARLLNLKVVELPVNIELTSSFSSRNVLRMLVDLLGIAYRLRLIHWYQRNLHNWEAKYNPILKW